jgi:4a-hydroxytetrahydrobiopterin dehydratase
VRHLKSYRIYESNSIQDIISDIKDMLLEIQDIGGITSNCREFNIFNYKTKTDDSEIRVWIRPIESDYDEYADDNFEIDDTVIEVFRRIIDYMKSTEYSEYGVVHDDGVQVLPMNLDNIDRQRQRGLMNLSGQETFGIWFRLPKESNISDKDIPGGWIKTNNKLVKDFKFQTFREAQKFVNKVADLSETQNHHPKIEWNYNVVQLILSTHDAGDIVTIKDIKLANSINEIYENN